MSSTNKTELFEALEMLEKERNVPIESLIEKVKNAILVAVRRDYGCGDNVNVEINPEKKTFKVSISKEVVEEVENPGTQISLEEALNRRSKAKIGSVIDIPLETKEFGRISATSAKHVIRQGIREAERSAMYEELQSRQGEITVGTITRVNPVRGAVLVELGNGEAVLPKSEQVPSEILEEGQKVQVYIVDVSVSDKGPRVLISRTHPGLVKRLFEMEVPEIFDGIVEIKGIAREAGARTKIAVYSKDDDVDPRGACIGARGARVAHICDVLNGEKIDVVLYSEDPATYVAEALSPAKVVSVTITDAENKQCTASVPEDQLSLAIGNKGQNVRLAAKLTGYKIDIRPESGYWGE